jgi:hypothetical protein
MHDCKHFRLSRVIVLLCIVEFLRLETDGLTFLQKYST